MAAAMPLVAACRKPMHTVLSLQASAFTRTRLLQSKKPRLLRTVTGSASDAGIAAKSVGGGVAAASAQYYDAALINAIKK